MNRIYRTLWSIATQSWQAVPETAKSAGKKSKSSASGVVASFALSWVLTSSANAQAPPAINQLPTGGTVARGTATISQTATAQAAAMTVNQTSQRAVVNWNTFNIGSNASVNFVQPNAQAVTLNRVSDANPSQIFGRMSANGQVVLTNANGVYFAPGSSVDVGAITATTHSISDDNFMSGKLVFDRSGSSGKVINEGSITAALGGYVALLAPEVQNAGVVVARAGTVAMAAGETITLTLDGVGSLAGITTTPSAIATLIENKHAVQAPDGQIVLSAVALNKLLAGVIRNSGSLEANSLVNKGGKIVLEGDDIALTASSKLEAKGATGGGTVLVGGDWQGSGDMRQATKVTMEAGATIDASATDKGDGGKVVLWSDVHSADSVTRANGSIKAEAGPNGGDGGQIETSGHLLNVDGISVSTKSPKEKNGQWLLDPYNVYIMSDAATSGESLASDTYTPNKYTSYIQSSNLNSALSSANVTVTTIGASSGTATGNIYVYDGIAWSANKLTLNASSNIYVYCVMNGTGTASLALKYGQSTAAGTGNAYYINAPINLPAGDNFSTQLGNTGAVKTYTVVTTLGTKADATTAPTTLTLQGISASSKTGNYALGADIDATDTQNWGTVNSFQYFTPIGIGTPTSTTNAFKGIFDGLGHQINNLKVKYTGTSSYGTGFFGSIGGPNLQIRNIALTNENIAGYSGVGGLYGIDDNTTITLNNIYTSGTIFASNATVGGIGGQFSNGTATNVSSSANVTTTYLLSGKTFEVGGLFGYSQATIKYGAYYGTITANATNYAGAIQGDARANTNDLTTSYFDSTKNSSFSGSGTQVGVATKPAVGIATADLTVQSNFPSLDFVNVWAMGPSYPLPQFMVSNILRVVPSSPTVVYGNTPTSTISYVGLLNNDTASTAFTGGVLPTANVPTNLNAGSYPFSASGGSASNYFVIYDPATSTITPKPLTVNGLSVTTTKVYNNSTAAATSGSSTVTLLSTEAKGSGSDTDGRPYETVTVSGTATAAYNSKDVATATTISYTGGLTVSSSNYSIIYPSSVSGTITAKPLNPSGLTLTTTKIYDSSNTAVVTGTAGIAGSAATNSSTDGKYFSTDTVTLSTSTPTASYSQSNVGTGLTITYSGLGTLGGASASNYSLNTTASTSGIINKATLSLTGSQVYNGTTTFLGSNLTATGVAGQTFALTASNATLTSPDVTLTPVSKSFTGVTLGLSSNGGLSSNYNTVATTATVNVSITPATVTLVANKVYDGTQNLTNTQFTLTGVTVSGTAQTLGYSGTASLFDANVATTNNYVVTSSLTLANGTGLATNYVLPSSAYSSYNTATLSRANAVVSANKTYNGDTSLSAGQVSITGVIVGGVAQVLDFTGSAVLSNANVTSANKYVITTGMTLTNGSTGLASNYNLPAASYNAMRNTASISPVTLTVTAGTDISSAGSIYGDSLVTGTVSFANKVIGDDVNAIVTITEPAASRSTGGKLKAGDYYQSASTSLTGAQAGNYLFSGITSSTANYSITQRALVGSGITNAQSAYASALTPGTAQFSNAVAGDAVSSTVTVNTSSTSASGNFIAGAYTQTAGTTLSGADAANYTFAGYTTPTSNYTIQKLALAGTQVAASSSTYGSSLAPGAVTWTNVVGADDVSSTATVVTGTRSTSNKFIAGTYAQTVASNSLSGADAANYSFATSYSTPSNNYTIQKLALTAAGDIASASSTYGSALTPGNLAFANTVGSDVVNATVSVNTSTLSSSGKPIVGSYTQTASTVLTGADASNYTYVGHTSATSNYTINALALTGGSIAAGTSAYGSTITAGAVSFSNAISGDQVTTSASVNTTTLSGAGLPIVGTYSQTSSTTLTGSDASNYTLPTGITSAANYSITQKALTLSVPGASRMYDGTTVIYPTGAASIQGLIDSDRVVPSAGNVTGFVDKNVGTNKAVLYTGFTFAGLDASNYVLSANPASTAEITAKPITVSGITALDRAYNGTTTASLSVGTAALTTGASTTTDNKVYSADNVTINASAAVGTFANANVGTAKPVTITGLALSGTDAGNYIVTDASNATATITPKALTVSGTTVANKTYDSTTSASLSNGTLVGVISADLANVGLTESGTFADKNVGTAKQVTATDVLTGSAAGNYSLTQPTGLSADITKADLIVSGITAANKVYDTTTNATLMGAAVVNALGSDVVSVSGTGTGQFADKNAGSAKPVSVTGYTLTGTDAVNYNVLQPAGLTADITKADLAISGITAANKVYDATTNATLSGTAVVNALGNDVVSVSGTGTGQFTDKNAGTAKAVWVTGYSLTGADAGNYSVQQPAGLTADITKASLTLTADNANKLFGNPNPTFTATLSGFVGGETLATSGVTGTATGSTTATLNSDPGTAAITPAIGTLASNNYDITQLVDGQLTIKAISALGNDQVSALVGSQLSTLSARQIGSFTASQLQVFSAQQVSSLSVSQVSGLTATQVASLNNAQLQALTLAQVAALTPNQLAALTPAQIEFLTRTSALNELQVLSLSPTQIAGVAPEHVAKMSAAELGAFTNAQLQALSTLQIASIAPGNFASFTPEQIMALSISQVQNLSPEQLATFTPAQVASISAAELAYFDARQLAAIGIYPKVETPAQPQAETVVTTAPVPALPVPVLAVAASPIAEPTPSVQTANTVAATSDATSETDKPFEAAIPVMTEVAAPTLVAAAAPVSASAQAPVAKPEVAPALSPRALQGLLFGNTTESSASTGVLPITILNNAQAKPVTAGVAFEQEADTVSLRTTNAPAVPPMSAKLVFSDKLTTFMVAAPNGEMVAFEGSLLNNRMIIVAPSIMAKRLARVEMNLVLAAAVTSLGKTNRVMLAELKGVLLDLR